MKDKYEAAKEAFRSVWMEKGLGSKTAFSAAMDAMREVERGETKPRMMVNQCPHPTCLVNHRDIHPEHAGCRVNCTCHGLPCREATAEEIRVGHRIDKAELTKMVTHSCEHCGWSVSVTMPKVVIAAPDKPKPRRMKANEEYQGGGYHCFEHAERDTCKFIPPCVPVDAPEWKAGDTVEIIEGCGGCFHPQERIGTRTVLTKQDRHAGGWSCTDGWNLCPSCARLVPQRDWEKEIESGDQCASINYPIIHDVLTRNGSRVIYTVGGWDEAVNLRVTSKRPDRPGDGFERIGHEAEGIYHLAATGDDFYGCHDDHPITRRHEFRRVYAKRD